MFSKKNKKILLANRMNPYISIQKTNKYSVKKSYLEIL